MTDVLHRVFRLNWNATDRDDLSRQKSRTVILFWFGRRDPYSHRDQRDGLHPSVYLVIIFSLSHFCWGLVRFRVCFFMFLHSVWSPLISCHTYIICEKSGCRSESRNSRPLPSTLYSVFPFFMSAGCVSSFLWPLLSPRIHCKLLNESNCSWFPTHPVLSKLQ